MSTKAPNVRLSTQANEAPSASFQTSFSQALTLQVRNKLAQAYTDIMNMAV